MEISENRQAGVVFPTVSGKLDAMAAKPFEERILAQIDSGDRRLVIDLSQLEYISSSGLRVLLLAAKRRLHTTNGKIVFCSLKEHIRQVFDLSGFSSIFSIYGSRDEAFKSR